MRGTDHGGQGGDQGATDQPDRLTVREAAGQLGITADAVRSRIKRGTLRTEHRGGRVYVLVGDRGATDQPDQPTDQNAARVEDLREQVAYLRDQLRREQDAHAEARRLLAGALERIPAIEAPETPESPVPTPTDDAGAAERATEEPERAPWWRRWFGT